MPASLAKAASELMRSGLSPATIRTSAAVSGPIPYQPGVFGQSLLVLIPRNRAPVFRRNRGVCRRSRCR